MAGFEPQVGERSEDSVGGPGRRLRLARERRELPMAAVADALHLERRIVQAIEDDDYDDLPPVTFTRGYLRSYARFVDVPEQEVLEAFDRLGIHERQPPIAPTEASARRKQGLPAGTPWLLTLLAAAVLGVAGWFWYRDGDLGPMLAPTTNDSVPAESGRETGAGEVATSEGVEPLVELDDRERSATTTETARDTQADSQAEAPPADANDASAPASGEAPTAGAGERVPAPDGEQADAGDDIAEPAADERPDGSDTQSPAVTDENQPADTAEQVASASGADSEATASTPSPGATAGQGDTGAGQAATTAGTPESAAGADEATMAEPEASAASGDTESSQPPQTGSGELVFEFSGESWMEVTDARGERLLFGLVRDDGGRTLRGEPPFSIVIGDVGAVSLRYNGDPVSLEERASGRVARFSLGEAP
ncbi:RodZ domain-containing protein [Arhodomonas sp. AD133]|uniref:RodZ domain-containing protein n=1 Tax=Arhodomonas sp. AD133 TaxID=3415009 RepID=UPI003EB7A45D